MFSKKMILAVFSLAAVLTSCANNQFDHSKRYPSSLAECSSADGEKCKKITASEWVNGDGAGAAVRFDPRIYSILKAIPETSGDPSPWGMDGFRAIVVPQGWVTVVEFSDGLHVVFETNSRGSKDKNYLCKEQEFSKQISCEAR